MFPIILLLIIKLSVMQRIPYQDRSTKTLSKWKFRIRAPMVKWHLPVQTTQGWSLGALCVRCLSGRSITRALSGRMLVLLQTMLKWRLRAHRVWTLLACRISPLLQLSPVAGPGGMGAGCLGYHMADSPAWVLTPSPVNDITRLIQQMDGPSGRVGVATPSVAAVHALRATPSPLMLALGELEFARIFLIYVYHGE